jgi:hypothetical protein
LSRKNAFDEVIHKSLTSAQIGELQCRSSTSLPIKANKNQAVDGAEGLFLGAVRRRTFICCRNIQISTSSAVRDRNRSATIQTMSLTRSLIPQEHRPILDQLLVRLSLR